MKPSSHAFLVFLSFAFGFFGNSLFAKNSNAGPPCPHFLVEDGPDLDSELDHVPTTPFHGECRLHRDVLGLAKSMNLKPGITLDCQGHKITPATGGVLGDADSRSDPELAIFVNGAGATRVKDCVIEGFDHGIFVANAKSTDMSEGSRGSIQGNRIDARFVAVHLVLTDNFDIKENQLTWRTRGGIGVLIQQDSSRIAVSDNEVAGDFPATNQGAVLMPGPTATEPGGPIASNLNSNPVFSSTHGAILIVQALGPHPQLFNAIVNGELYQFTTTESSVPNDEFTQDIFVEGNSVAFDESNTTEDGIVASNALLTTVRANTIGSQAKGANVRQAMRAGGLSGPAPVGNPRQFPGSCSEKTSRLCLSHFDCNIPEIDGGGTDSCSLPPTKAVFWYPRDLKFEDNTIYGPFLVGIATVGENVVVAGNSILGVFPSGPAASVGIALAGKKPLETAVVHRNSVSGVATGLRFMNVFQGEGPAFFGVEVSLNDITGYGAAVVTTNDYVVASELSVDGRGNYWGLACPPGFDSAFVKKDNGSLQPAVVDSHPYSEAVAGLDDESLPATCE